MTNSVCFKVFKVGRGSEVDPKVALGFAESSILTEDFHFPQLALKLLELAP